MASALGTALVLLAPALAAPAPAWLPQATDPKPTSARRLQQQDEWEYEPSATRSKCSSFNEDLCSNGLFDDAVDRECKGTEDCAERCRVDCDNFRESPEGKDNSKSCPECVCECDPVWDSNVCCKPDNCGNMNHSLCPSGLLVDSAQERQCLTANCNEGDVGTCCKPCDLCDGKHLLPVEYEHTDRGMVYCPRMQEECTEEAGSPGDFEQQCSVCLESINRSMCCSNMDATIPTRLFAAEYGTWHGHTFFNRHNNDTFISVPSQCGDLRDNQWAFHEDYIEAEDSLRALQICLGKCLGDGCCLAARMEQAEEGWRCYIHNDCVMDAFFDHKREFKNRESYDEENDTLIGYPCKSFSQCTFFRTTTDRGAHGAEGDEHSNRVEVTEGMEELDYDMCDWEQRQQLDEDWGRLYQELQSYAVLVLVISSVCCCCCCCACLGCCWFFYNRRAKSKA